RSDAATYSVTPAASGKPTPTECCVNAMTATPAIVASPNRTEDPQANPRLFPDASITDATVEPSGILCRNTARKITQPSQFETRNPEVMAIPSKNVWIISPISTE